MHQCATLYIVFGLHRAELLVVHILQHRGPYFHATCFFIFTHYLCKYGEICSDAEANSNKTNCQKTNLQTQIYKMLARSRKQPHMCPNVTQHYLNMPDFHRQIS